MADFFTFPPTDPISLRKILCVGSMLKTEINNGFNLKAFFVNKMKI